MSRAKEPGPTPEQLAAVIQFAEKHGKGWKEEMRLFWLRGCCGEPNSALLQQVRNWHGPVWLNRFSLKKATGA